METFTGNVSKYPARASLFWYLMLIVAGAAVLQLPQCRASGATRLSAVDALFTATSAVCVTGLTVSSTAHDFSLLGQFVIVLLIQLGGIGIMSVTTFVTLSLGGRARLRERAVLADTLGAHTEPNLAWVLRHVFWFTFVFELVGVLLLAARNLWEMPWADALWQALFHSVSAFCNAGFALYDDSLIRYQSDVYVNLVIMALIITGGIGYPVMLDLKRHWRGYTRLDWEHLHLHSKVMLLGTGALVVLGTAAILAIEWDGCLSPLPVWQRVLVSLFQSVTCRTAGFNSIDLTAFTNASLFIMIVLMMIGAGPCSTAGGFKVSTLFVLMLRAWKSFSGERVVNLFRRTIPDVAFQRAIATLMLFSVVGMVALCSLLVVEQAVSPPEEAKLWFLEDTFEVFSALGTVGLSLGATGHLTFGGKVIVILLMFIGRLGPISVFAALSQVGEEVPIEFPNEEPLIG